MSSELNFTPVELNFSKVAGLPQLASTMQINWQRMVQTCMFCFGLFSLLIKVSFRFYSHTLNDHNFFRRSLCYYLFIELGSEFNCGAKMIQTSKIIRIVSAPSFINRCV